ncbi:MAG: murD [Chthoniobacteraceae bacterium]|nr:murD [Chthoniobacteraceae bacterium]
MIVSYKNKQIAVLGAGESGESAAILLNQNGAIVTVLDSAPEEKLCKKIESLGALGIRVIAGPSAESDGSNYDLTVISPGIDPAMPLVQNFLHKPAPMIGELELAYEMCRCPIIAITGTNGKTTTTQLIDKMLSGCGVRTVACGNIGPAFSARVSQSGELDVVTVEVSSFQLERIEKFHADIAVWLGFAPDHLDRYSSMEEYYAAKIRVFENQTPADWAIVNLRDKLPKLAAKKITFSAYESGGDFSLREGVIFYGERAVLAMSDTRLRGAHNAENLMAALGVGLVRGIEFERMTPLLCRYEALPHRCEILRSINGVEWINDSKGTNLDSVEKALLSETQPVVLIAGGKDKGFEYESLTELVVGKCRAVVVLGEMSDRIEALWKDSVPCLNAGWSLERAVELASQTAQPGDVVLFSPGTSSFDMFKNYADRGNQFRALVLALPTYPTTQ